MLLAGEVFCLKNLAVDDERLALQLLTDAIQAVLPKAEVFAFSKPGEALSCARENRCDIAFLDVRMRSMTGLELARKLKGLCPRINIIFVTGYSEYVGEAMQLHASGYLEKPVTAEKVRREVEDLRHPVLSSSRARCCGRPALAALRSIPQTARLCISSGPRPRNASPISSAGGARLAVSGIWRRSCLKRPPMI